MNTTFIQWLQERLEDSDLKIIPVESKVPEGAEVIGTVPEDLQRLWSFFNQEVDKMRSKAKSMLPAGGLLGFLLGGTGVKPPSEEDMVELNRAKDRVELMRKIFWYELEESLGDIARKGDGIAICEGYQVIVKEKREDSDLEIGDMHISIVGVGR